MRIVLAVTASVAALLTRKLVAAILEKPDVELKVVTAKKTFFFFDPKEVALPIITEDNEHVGERFVKGQAVQHIQLGEWSDVLLIAPLSAGTLSRMAHGDTESIVTSLVLGWPRGKRMIVAPAMNTRMWSNPITQENLEKVKQVYGAQVIEPIEGKLACGTEGKGAMARIETIVAAL